MARPVYMTGTGVQRQVGNIHPMVPVPVAAWRKFTGHKRVRTISTHDEPSAEWIWDGDFRTSNRLRWLLLRPGSVG